MHRKALLGRGAAMLTLLVALRASTAEVTAQLRLWNDYRAIMWVGDTAYKKPDKLPLFFQRLREMGINTAMAYGDGNLEPLLDQKFPYYVENMVNKGLCLKWNSNVRDWDKFVTGWVKEGRPESALARDYCLDAAEWRGWARGELQRLVRKNREHEPLAYDLRDELSTTISANPFDYDFNPVALARFRDWLKTQYSDVAALNAEWETHFNSWEEIKPFTTDQIKNRMASGDAIPRGKPDWQQLQALKFDAAAAGRAPTHWNFSPWADFRTYMDLSLARTLNELRQAAHELDPRTPVGIEGTQMPHAFGGYDLWRLSQAVDWVEPYDIGNAREIFGSFMPGRPLLTTVFESDTNHARRRLWHLLLEGDRGCIVWWSEDCIDWKSESYELTPKARALAPVLKELASPLAALFLRATREHDPIFIHYSQPSIQVDWLLESTVDGSTWLRRFSSFEAEHNRMLKVRNGWVKALQDLGYSPQFISSEQIENGQWANRADASAGRDGRGTEQAAKKSGLASGNAVIVLPGSLAISDKEARELRKFLEAQPGRRLLADSAGGAIAGIFDEHGKLRLLGALDDMLTSSGGFGLMAAASGVPSSASEGDMAQYAAVRLKGNAAWSDWLEQRLKGLRPEIGVTPSARVRVHRFRAGRGRLVAFERNIDYHMSEELKQAGGNEPLEKPVELEASFSRKFHLYELRTEKYLGYTDRIQFELNPWQPSLFALTESKLESRGIVATLAE
jgi:hypothetical protein